MRLSRHTMRILALALTAGMALSLVNVIPAHSQAVPVLAQKVSQTPSDPLDPAWQNVTAISVPLSAQHITLPGGGNIFSVQVRSVHNETTIAIQLSWQDATRNGAALRAQEFRDGAAVQFPVQPTALPFYCMGQRTGAVNLWHWKADWQDDIDAFQDVQNAWPAGAFLSYPQDQDKEGLFTTGRSAGNPLSQAARTAPVESLVAAGFGTLTTAGVQAVQGKGVWQDGRWTVVFVRALAAQAADEAEIPLGGTTAVAFAVWDGANNDRDGQKATSTWLTLQMEGQSKGGALSAKAGLFVFIALGAIVTGGVWLAMPGRRPEPAAETEPSEKKDQSENA